MLMVTIDPGPWVLKPPSLCPPPGQVVVPGAAVEELLPAGQLLRRATHRATNDYAAAKASFLSTLHTLHTAAAAAGDEFREQVAALVEAAAAATAAEQLQQLQLGNSTSSSIRGRLDDRGAAGGGGSRGGTGGSGDVGPPGFPGLHELVGNWNGRVTAVGGGGVDPRLEFNLAGADWKWGHYKLDKVGGGGGLGVQGEQQYVGWEGSPGERIDMFHPVAGLLCHVLRVSGIGAIKASERFC